MNLEPGTKISHYNILSEIGKGGMGEVYLAEDTKLGRKVAIKFLSEELCSDGEKLNRFVQEAKATSALNHPNILTVFEIGETGDSHFIASEFVEGETLRELLMRRAMSVERALGIAEQVVEALSSAHEAGIVHRDIKPENIMIRPDGYAKILDFGIAKLIANDEAAQSSSEAQTVVKTSPGTIMGTANYMSPEQAKGSGTDGRSDIFSFGIVFFEMLAGRLPFEGGTGIEVLASIINQKPRSLTEFVPSIPEGLDRICLKALAKEPSDRFQTCGELLHELKNLGTDSVRNPGSENPTVQVVNEDLVRSSGNLPDLRKDTLLLTDFRNLTDDEVFDNTLKLALEITLAQSPSIDIFPVLRVRNTLALMGFSVTESVNAELAREICIREQLKAYISGTIANLGSVYMLTLEAVNAKTGETIARRLEQANSKERVLDALSNAASGLRKELGESLSSIEKYDVPLDRATTPSLEALKLFTIGTQHHAVGQPLEAIPYFKRAVKIDPEFAYAYGALSVMYQMMKQPRVAAEYASKAYRFRDRTSELEKLRITYFYHSMATGDLEKGIESLKIYRETYPRDERPCINLCWTYSLIGQFQKALAAAEDAVRINPNHVIGQGNLIGTLIILNRFDEARLIYEKINRLGLVNDAIVRGLMFNIAFVKDDHDTMLELIDATIGEQDGHIAINWQAETAAFQGRLRASEKFSSQAVDMAIASDAKEPAAQYLAERNLRSAVFQSFGAEQEFADTLRARVQTSIDLESNQMTLTKNAISLALVNEIEAAKEMLADLRDEYPKDYVVKKIWEPCVEAAIQLRAGYAEKAVDMLKLVEGSEAAAEFIPQYLRGLAYLESDQNAKASAEFQKILDHRGEAPLSVLYPLAQLGRARSSSNKEDFDLFFDLWSDADPDAPPLMFSKEIYTDLADRIR